MSICYFLEFKFKRKKKNFSSLASGPAFQKRYVHRQPFMNIDVYPLVCSVLHLNLNPTQQQISEGYCQKDAKPSRIIKMLAPIKFSGNQNENSSIEQSSINSKNNWFGHTKRYFSLKMLFDA